MRITKRYCYINTRNFPQSCMQCYFAVWTRQCGFCRTVFVCLAYGVAALGAAAPHSAPKRVKAHLGAVIAQTQHTLRHRRPAEFSPLPFPLAHPLPFPPSCLRYSKDAMGQGRGDTAALSLTKCIHLVTGRLGRKAAHATQHPSRARAPRCGARALLGFFGLLRGVSPFAHCSARAPPPRARPCFAAARTRPPLCRGLTACCDTRIPSAAYLLARCASQYTPRPGIQGHFFAIFLFNTYRNNYSV